MAPSVGSVRGWFGGRRARCGGWRSVGGRFCGRRASRGRWWRWWRVRRDLAPGGLW